MSAGVPSTNPLSGIPSEGLSIKSRSDYPISLSGTVFVSTAAGTAVASTATATSLLYNVTGTTKPSTLPTGVGVLPIPATGFIWGGGWPYAVTPTSSNASGGAFRLRAWGTLGTTATAQTLIVQPGLRLNSTTATFTALGTTGTATVPGGAAITTMPWDLEVVFIAQTYNTSTNGKFSASGRFATTSAVATAASTFLIAAGPPAQVSLDATLSYYPDIVVTWGASDAANTIQVLGWTLESLT